MTLRNPLSTWPLWLSVFVALPIGCANPWRTPFRKLNNGPPAARESLENSSLSQARSGAYDEMLDEIDSLGGHDPRQREALKQALHETSAELSPLEQEKLLRLAKTMYSPPAPAGSEDQASSVQLTSQQGQPPDAPTPESSPRASSFRITDEDDLAAADSVSPEAAGHAAEKIESANSNSTPAAAGSNASASDASASDASPSDAQAAVVDQQPAAVQLAAHQQDEPAPPAPLAEPTEVDESDQDDPLESGQWKQDLAAAIEALEKELIWGEFDETERTRMEAMLRVLYAIDNRRDKAVSPIQQLKGDERAFWQHQLFGLVVSLDAEDRHVLSRRAALALREVRTAVGHLANISSLDLRNLALCTDVQSYGRYVEFKPYTFDPGQEVILYVEVENFAAEEKGPEYETELQGEYTILDSAGQQVVRKGLPLDKQACNNRRRDYFIAYRVFLPNEISAGEYTLVLTMEDIKGHKSNQGSLEFRIR